MPFDCCEFLNFKLMATGNCEITIKTAEIADFILIKHFEMIFYLGQPTRER